jgi:uncharacterized cupin superfamily protein
MLRAWVAGRSAEPAAVAHPQVPASPGERRRATRLAAEADRAWQSATWALAKGDWTAAAEWEEQRVLSEDKLARLPLSGASTTTPKDQH